MVPDWRIVRAAMECAKERLILREEAEQIVDGYFNALERHLEQTEPYFLMTKELDKIARKVT